MLLSLHEGEAKTFGVPAVVPIHGLSHGRNRDKTPNAHRDEAQSDLDVVVAVYLAELRGDAGAEGVVGCEGDGGTEEDKSYFFLEYDDESC